MYEGCVSRILRVVQGLSASCALGFPGGLDCKESTCNAGDRGLLPGMGRFPWRRGRLPTPVFLPEEFHGQRSLVGYRSQGCKEWDTTEMTCPHTVVLISAVQHNDLVTLIYTFFFILFSIIVYHRILNIVS